MGNPTSVLVHFMSCIYMFTFESIKTDSMYVKHINEYRISVLAIEDITAEVNLLIICY